MTKPIGQEVKDAIRAVREASGATYKKLAKRFDVSRNTVANILKGDKKKPTSHGVKFQPVAPYYCRPCLATVFYRPCVACHARNAGNRRKHTFG